MAIETFWVSFADDEKFRGVALVDVDVEDNDWMPLVIRETIDQECNAGSDTSVQIQRLRQRLNSVYKNTLILDETLLMRIKGELDQQLSGKPH